MRTQMDMQRADYDRLAEVVEEAFDIRIDGSQIIVLDQGKAVGEGTHRQLLETCPVYREIALSQLSKEELGL